MKKESLLVPLSVALLLGTGNVSLAEGHYNIPKDESAEIKNSVYEKLIQQGHGGAIYNEGTINSVSDSTFENNRATSYKIELDEGWEYNTETKTLTGTVNKQPFEAKAVQVYDQNSKSWILAYYDDVLQKNVAVGVLKEEANLSRGGAIYNGENATLGPITNSTFSNNTVAYQGGAIYNANPNSELIIENSNFINNKTDNSSMFNVVGGAISNTGSKMTVKNSTFTGNSAILENTQVLNNENEISKYNSGWGGAIYNEGELNIENSRFKNNKAGYGGGAIFHEQMTGTNRPLTIKNSKFYNNQSDGTFEYSNVVTKDNKTYNIYYNNIIDSPVIQSGGGAILTGGALTTVENSEFIANKAVVGGAINSEGALTVTNSDFKDNTAIWHKSGNNIEILNEGTENEEVKEITYDEYLGDGGAINVIDCGVDDKVNITNSNFENNSSGKYGGAIASTGIESNIDNSTFVSNSSANGGALYLNYRKGVDNVNKITNSTFNSNTANNNGGAINSNNVNTTITDSNFTGNKTEGKGGAIYQKGGITNIIANNKDVNFTGNKAKSGSDIYIEDGDLNLNANANKNITFNGGIVGKNSAININNVYDNLSSTGNIVVNNFVSSEKDSHLAVNVYGGTLKALKENYLDGVNLTLADNSTFDMMNGEIGVVNTNTFNSSNANLMLDMDLSEKGGFDLIAANSATGSVNLSAINIIKDAPKGVMVFEVPLDEVGIYDTMSVTTPELGINTATNDYIYTTIANPSERKIYVVKNDGVNDIKLDGFTYAVNGSGMIAGTVEAALSENRVFSATKDVNITGEQIDAGWTGNLGGKNLTVMGQGHTINGNNKIGIQVNNGQTLAFTDANIKGFKTSENRNGALTVKDGGNVNITTFNHDVVLGGTKSAKGSQNNIIYMDGTNSTAMLETNNSKKITVQDPMRSANVSNTVNLKGKGTIEFDNRIETLTLTNENLNTIHKNKINGVVYNLQSGNVKFENDNYLSGANTLNFNGGTLNLINNSVNTINIDALNINSNSNIMVDVDLAKKSMDRLTAKNYKTDNYFVNVTRMNLLSDADSVVTKILFADDKLKNNVKTSVSEVAYSPIWKYGVNYDKNTGEFTFTQGAGSGGAGAYNPAVLAAPVAAQMGGYMNMIDTYANAFNHMDIQMLKSSNTRFSQINANKYAIADNQHPMTYNSNEMNSSGMWFKPYVSYDSIGLKNGPKVSNTSYGSFFGGDSGARRFKNGFSGVFSPYIAYQGSHQSYLGNSIYQNGGTLGFTGTLYKGNFFTGLTAGVGMSIAEASTMFGHDDFSMLMTGVASKSGYNFEFKEGKYIIQPSLQLSYTFVNTFDYTNNAGVRMNSDAMHAFQILPSVRFIMNTKSGWQPYLTAGMNWNIINNSSFMANNTALPDMSVKPYVQYGVGVQKTMEDRLTAFLQVVLRHGGRNGIAAAGGFRYLLGEKKKNKPAKL